MEVEETTWPATDAGMKTQKQSLQGRRVLRIKSNNAVLIGLPEMGNVGPYSTVPRQARRGLNDSPGDRWGHPRA
eukprot:12906272-Prorocentrum_lima.AAC.1